MDGSIALGVGLCRGHLADRMDGLAFEGAKSWVDGGIDSSVDGGALCVGASDHVGYESDFLDHGGAGLSGRGGDGEPDQMGGVPFLCLYGVGVFGQRADGMGRSAFRRPCLGWDSQTKRGKAGSSLGIGDTDDLRARDELVRHGVLEVSRIMEIFPWV